MNGMDVDFAKLVQPASVGQKGLDTKEVQALFVKSIDTEKRQITAIASTGSVDRDGEIILPSAFKETLPQFMKNPVILACHQHRLSDGRSPVVGKAVKAWLDKKALHVVIEFAKTELGDEYWHLYRDGFQRAFSIGFMHGRDDYTQETIDGRPVKVINKVELLEISCVPVPSNREALSKSAKQKQQFVEQKRQERDEEKILAEIMAEDPLFEQKCEEYAELIFDYSVESEPANKPASESGEVSLSKCIGLAERAMIAAFGDADLYRRYKKFLEHTERGYRIGSEFTQEEVRLFEDIKKNGIQKAKGRVLAKAVECVDDSSDIDFVSLVSGGN